MRSLLLLVALSIGCRGTPEPCEQLAYWSGMANMEGDNLWAEMRRRIAGHTVIPYSHRTRTDVWAALIELDRDPTNSSNVIEIYTRRSVPISTMGSTTGWNREHLWPRSLGVGSTGPDTSDLHALRPANWGVNAARGNLWFDECSSGCTTPGHPLAPGTTRSSESWTPPAEVRVRGGIHGDAGHRAFAVCE